MGEAIEDMIGAAGEVNEEVQAQPEQPGRPSFRLPEWLMAKTGSGEIEDYLSHPMNFGKSRALAQIIRGASGMFGALDFAIIDVVMGALQLGKPRPQQPDPYVVKTWEGAQP